MSHRTGRDTLWNVKGWGCFRCIHSRHTKATTSSRIFLPIGQELLIEASRVRYAGKLKASRPMCCKIVSASDSVRARKKIQRIHVKMNVLSMHVSVHSEGKRKSPAGISSALSVCFAGRKVSGKMARPLRPPQNTKFQAAPCQKPLSKNGIMTLKALRQRETCPPPRAI